MSELYEIQVNAEFTLQVEAEDYRGAVKEGTEYLKARIETIKRRFVGKGVGFSYNLRSYYESARLVGEEGSDEG